MAFEFYWHHAVQHWDYENTFHWANGAMFQAHASAGDQKSGAACGVDCRIAGRTPPGTVGYPELGPWRGPRGLGLLV